MGDGFQPSSRRALRFTKAQFRDTARTSVGLGIAWPATRPPAAASATATGTRKLDRGWLDPRQPSEIGEQAVEGVVAVAEDVALADAASFVGQEVACGLRPALPPR